MRIGDGTETLNPNPAGSLLDPPAHSLKTFLAHRGRRRHRFLGLRIPVLLLPISLANITLAQSSSIEEFQLPVGDHPTEITTGTDGNLWFIVNGSKVGRLTPTGELAEFDVPSMLGDAGGIASGPDGRIWFADLGKATGGRICRITPLGSVEAFPVANGAPYRLATGSDGNLWFTELDGRIGRITIEGVITQFAATDFGAGLDSIATGSDGNLWFTEVYGNAVGRMTTTGTVTRFLLATPASNPYGIVPGPDGNMWFTEFSANAIGRITPEGVITEFSMGPLSVDDLPNGPYRIAAGNDGNLWFTKTGFSTDRIGRISISGSIVEFVLSPGRRVVGITAGSDGSIWFTEQGVGRLGRITSATRGVVPPAARDKKVRAIRPRPSG